ncbi:hypothetical protein [Plantactinospora endophytica]|uniref:Uncharacterized protein n=1 Tax=Plantactinospora endophytica TaxID=673535 RepID=A0ABQ4DUM0_9ACTN|nr:hypothetical protein [Plantactinospora endophytica]GIG86138.1 hypothetical protein Pen02_10740 [Plantactinospora endophytica]
MNGGPLTLVVSGPVPGSARGDAESASALARELHTRTILHVARPGVDDPAPPFSPDERSEPDEQQAEPGGSGTSLLGRKGGGVGSMAELVVTGLFSATTVAALAQVAVAFVARGAARRITLRDGRRTLTITAPSEDTEQMVVEWLGVPPTQSGTGSGAD